MKHRPRKARDSRAHRGADARDGAAAYAVVPLALHFRRTAMNLASLRLLAFSLLLAAGTAFAADVAPAAHDKLTPARTLIARRTGPARSPS